MNVSLPHELEQYVRDGVASGRYKSASEAVREGLQLLRQIERSREMRQTLADAKAHELKMEVFRLPFPSDFDL